jgi:hypothetical protein
VDNALPATVEFENDSRFGEPIMRMYAHDYIWGVQDRRALPAPRYDMLVLAGWLLGRIAGKRRA